MQALASYARGVAKAPKSKGDPAGPAAGCNECTGTAHSRSLRPPAAFVTPLAAASLVSLRPEGPHRSPKAQGQKPQRQPLDLILASMRFGRTSNDLNLHANHISAEDSNNAVIASERSVVPT